MKRSILQIILAVLCLSARAQKVSNIRAEQLGQEIVVFYSLETASPCEISLLLSQDNGSTWSAPLKNVSGDVGKNISAGEKKITWKVLEEREQLYGDKFKFKVVAICKKKTFEPEMVFVEGGTFQMGSTSGDFDEKPVHSVTLKSFYIGKHEFTQAQWRTVMGSNAHHNSDCDNCPVVLVSWNEVQQYIQELNAQTGKKYRLPTEAEWEYAAKGGRASRGYTYSGSNDLGTVAWYGSNAGNKIHAAGTKQANELGIFDMSGNVREWCSEWYFNYSSSSITNSTGPASGANRVLRGGSWIDNAPYCRSTDRDWDCPDCGSNQSGFRLVLPIE